MHGTNPWPGDPEREFEMKLQVPEEARGNPTLGLFSKCPSTQFPPENKSSATSAQYPGFLGDLVITNILPISEMLPRFPGRLFRKPLVHIQRTQRTRGFPALYIEVCRASWAASVDDAAPPAAVVVRGERW